MTAVCTSPFSRRPSGMASFTDTTITSPIAAKRRLEPPSTLMHITRLAPELSATSRLVCIWIMASCSNAADDFPAFQLGLRRAFLNVDEFAFLEGVGFVVGVKARRAAHGLLQNRVQI